MMLVATSETRITKDIRLWFGWLVIIGPLHMCEQLLFGIDELYELKRQLPSIACSTIRTTEVWYS
jgi:hypothetical protein